MRAYRPDLSVAYHIDADIEYDWSVNGHIKKLMDGKDLNAYTT